MDTTAIAWGTGALLVAVELGRSLPALKQLRNHRSSDAVSPESIAVLAGSGAGWVLLAWLLGAWPVLIATLLWLILHAGICIMVWRVSPAKRTRMLRTFLITAAAFAAATMLLSPHLGVAAALGVTLGIATVIDSAPALVEGMRSGTTRGLSVLSLSVNTAEGFVYLAIGFGWVISAGDPGSLTGYILYGTVSLITNIPRLIRVTIRRRLALD
jgi:hypothetical protein